MTAPWRKEREPREAERMAYKTGYDEGYSDASDGLVDHDAAEEGWGQYIEANPAPVVEEETNEQLRVERDNWKRWCGEAEARAIVPSEGIASVAASELIEALLREVLDDECDDIHNVKAIARTLRAARAASDESLSRQSSEAAESPRSTRNTASERAAYEAHILSIGVPSMLERGSGIYSYTDRIIEAGWAGWQARAALRATTEPSPRTKP